jgi:uncharacterized protein YbcV (DUF1398 family)
VQANQQCQSTSDVGHRLQLEPLLQYRRHHAKFEEYAPRLGAPRAGRDATNLRQATIAIVQQNANDSVFNAIHQVMRTKQRASERAREREHECQAATNLRRSTFQCHCYRTGNAGVVQVQQAYQPLDCGLGTSIKLGSDLTDTRDCRGCYNSILTSHIFASLH